MQNFDLHVEHDKASDCLKLHVIGSPAGQETVKSGSIRRLMADVNIHNLMLSDRSTLKEVGQELRETIMPDPIWGLWRESIGRAGEQGLRMRVRPADVVAAHLPWELIFDADRSEFPALNIDTPFVRYLERQIPTPDHTGPTSDALRVLLIGASSDRRSRLNIKTETDRVEAALHSLKSNRKAAIVRVEGLHINSLKAVLLKHKPHVFHFAGTAEWDSGSGTCALLLDGSDPSRIETEVLATFLRGSGVQVVVLNASDTATNADQLWTGMAHTLVLAGIPAVVAMRASLTDKSAYSFADTLYTAISEREPLDKAVTHARQTVMAQNKNGEWLVPALFQRVSEVSLPIGQASSQAGLLRLPEDEAVEKRKEPAEYFGADAYVRAAEALRVRLARADALTMMNFEQLVMFLQDTFAGSENSGMDRDDILRKLDEIALKWTGKTFSALNLSTL